MNLHVKTHDTLKPTPAYFDGTKALATIPQFNVSMFSSFLKIIFTPFCNPHEINVQF